jgi:hypothetical protein
MLKSRGQQQSMGDNMQKGFTLALTFLLVVTVAATAAGCGSDTKQAQQYMKKGDGQLQNVESAASAWSAQVNSIGADPAKIVGEVQQARATGDNLLKASQAAKSEFEKINGLNDAADYKKYAELRIGELTTIDQIVQKMYEFLDKRVAMVRSGDLSFYPRLQQQAQDEINAVSEKGRKIEQEADRLKSDKKL